MSVFFWRCGSDLRGRRAARISAAEAALRQCCEAHLERLLGPEERELVAREREVRMSVPLVQQCDAAMLLGVLPVFLIEPQWWGTDLVDRRLRVRLVAALLDFLLDLPTLRTRGGAQGEPEVVMALWRAQGALTRSEPAEAWAT